MPLIVPRVLIAASSGPIVVGPCVRVPRQRSSRGVGEGRAAWTGIRRGVCCHAVRGRRAVAWHHIPCHRLQEPISVSACFCAIKYQRRDLQSNQHESQLVFPDKKRSIAPTYHTIPRHRIVIIVRQHSFEGNYANCFQEA